MLTQGESVEAHARLACPTQASLMAACPVPSCRRPVTSPATTGSASPPSSRGTLVTVGRAGWLADQWAQPVPQTLADRAAQAEAAGQTAVFAAWNGKVRGVLVVADTVKPTSAAAITRLRRLGLRPVLLTGDNERAAQAEAAGQTAVFAAWDGKVRGVLIVSDTVKPTSAEAVARLRGLGLRPVLLTGDNERAARFVADTVGIDEVIAGVLPEGKAAAVKELQAAGRVVAMAGDGVNDAAALAQADLGLAMGTDAAIEAADLTLVRGDLRAVPDAILLSRRTLATIKGNLFWAFAYNAAAIPLAALGFLSPLIAGAAMAFSSVFVVTNSLRLRRFQPAR